MSPLWAEWEIVMRYLFGFMCVLALGVMPMVGCSETSGEGGGGGTAGSGGDGGSAGTGGTGGMPECQGPEDCDDVNDCTENACADGVCDFTPVENGTTCGDGSGTCEAGSCVGTFACTEQGIRDAVAVGGGPHTFDCADGTTMVTTETIVIDNDVILDGEGNLAVDGDRDHTVFEVGTDVTAELRGFTVARGYNTGSGGGIFNDGTLTLTNSTVSGNDAKGGSGAGAGGIYNLGTLTLTNSTVSGNSSSRGCCGGIYGGAVTLVNSTVSGNTGDGIGPGRTLTLTNSTVSGNTGDGVWSRRSITVANSTVSGNGESGIVAQGTLTLTNSTVSGNGELGIAGEGPLTLTNTLVDGDCSVFTVLVNSNGYNIESPGDTCGFDQGTDQVNVSADDLTLGELADNGGPTMTHALGAGSVAIDAIPAVDCEVDEDQRGVERPQGDGCDVGAVEMEVTP